MQSQIHWEKNLTARNLTFTLPAFGLSESVPPGIALTNERRFFGVRTEKQKVVAADKKRSAF